MDLERKIQRKTLLIHYLERALIGLILVLLIIVLVVGVANTESLRDIVTQHRQQQAHLAAEQLALIETIRTELRGADSQNAAEHTKLLHDISTLLNQPVEVINTRTHEVSRLVIIRVTVTPTPAPKRHR